MIIQISFTTFAPTFYEFQYNSLLKFTLIRYDENNQTKTGT